MRMIRTWGMSLIGVVICWTLLGAQAATRATVALLDFDFGSVQHRWSGNQDIGKGISDLIVDEVVNVTIFDGRKLYAKAMEAAKAKGSQRVFELRTYPAMEGKLGALDARFRDHTVALFKKHAITDLRYFHPTDADKGAANTLIYFLAHPSREAASASFKAFREDADWVKARTVSEKDGKLTAKVESMFLKPVDFSPVK